MRLTRSVFAFIVLGSLAWATPTAHAQLGLLSGCSARINFEQPKYLGRQAGLDSIQLSWVVPNGGSGNFGGGLGGINQGSPGLTCAGQAGFSRSAQVALTIVRKLGHRDSVSISDFGPLATPVQRIAQVPRATLETDPQSYEIVVSGTVQGFLSLIARATGSGAPALAGASLSNTTNPPVTGQCALAPAVTGLSLDPSGSSVNVSWSLSNTMALCMKVSSFNVQVKIVRADGATLIKNASVAPSSSSVQVPLGQPAGQVASFEVTVTAQLTSLLTLQGSLQGNF